MTTQVSQDNIQSSALQQFSTAVLGGGTTLTNTVSSINFTGAGVSTTNVGDAVTVTIEGGGGGGGSGPTVGVEYELTGTTTNAIESELFIDGISATRIPVTTGKVLFYTVDIVARRTDVLGDAAAFMLKSVAKNINGTVTDVGSVYEVQVAKTNAGLQVDCRADDANNSVNIYVTGVANQTYAWLAKVTALEV